MATQWQTYPVEFRGGLLSNMSLLQQGVNAVGSASVLQNFEVNKEGGYSKIRGYEKFSDTEIPGDGNVLGLKVVSSGRYIAARKVDADAVTAYSSDLVSGDIGKTAYYYSTGTTWNFTAVSGAANGGKVRHATYNFDGDEKIIFVDGNNYPSIYNTNGNTHTFLDASSTNINTDVQGADYVTIFKRTGFFAKDNLLLFTAPFTVDNFSVADGAGSISLAYDITGLAVFRDQLIVFTTDTISRLTGSSSADFRLDPITEKIGCINGDTIQEVGGDIMYLSVDGIRQLSATDRIGDFALDVASDKIKEDFNDFLGGSAAFASTIIREKSQYRLFKFQASRPSNTAEGLIATKVTPQGSSGIEWSTIKGIKVNVVDSVYSGTTENIGFANSDGYAYTMETTSSFDVVDGVGNPIEAIFESAYMPIGDPQVRKTMYKAIWYINPEGSLDLDFNVKFDFESSSRNNVIQPNTINIATAAGGVVFFGGGALFAASGGATFGSTLEKIYPTNIIGSGNTVALRIVDNSTNPTFTLDTAVLEYKTNDRQ
jgi:hypothetical protein